MRKLAVCLALCSGLCFAEEAKPAEKDTYTGSITLTVPGDRILDNIQIGVDFADLSEVSMRENQSAQNPDAMMQIGSKDVLTLKLDYKNKPRFRNTKMVQASATFYLFAVSDELKSLILEPKYYTKGAEFTSSGKTDAVFKIEVVEVAKAGDTEGRQLKVIDKVAFNVGKENTVPLGVKVNVGTKVGVRISSSETASAHVLHLPVRQTGTFLCTYDDGLETLSKSFYNPPVSFMYMKKDTQQINKRMRAFQAVADEINNYVRNSAAHGTGKIVEIPLQIKMKLAPPGASDSARVVIGPPPAPQAAQSEEKPKKKKTFLGF